MNYYDVYITHTHGKHALNSQNHYFVAANSFRSAVELSAQVDHTKRHDSEPRSSCGQAIKAVSDKLAVKTLNEFVTFCDTSNDTPLTETAYIAEAVQASGSVTEVVTLARNTEEAKRRVQRAVVEQSLRRNLITEVCLEYRFVEGHLSEIVVNIF